MGIALGQHTSATTAGNTTLSTAGITTVGGGTSAFYAFVSFEQGQFSSFVDSNSNVWRLIGERNFNSASSAARFYYCINGKGGASHTVTFTQGLSSTISMWFGEITLSTAYDVGQSSNDTVSPFTVTSPTTTQANEMLILGFTGNSGSNPATHAESTGFTIIDDVTNGSTLATGFVGWKAVTSTGAYTPSVTESGGSDTAVFIATFKEILNAPIAWITH